MPLVFKRCSFVVASERVGVERDGGEVPKFHWGIVGARLGFNILVDARSNGRSWQRPEIQPST